MLYCLTLNNASLPVHNRNCYSCTAKQMAMKKIYCPAFPVVHIVVMCCAVLAANSIHAQWTKTQGPPGINVNTFYTKDSILFAGTSSKGVFRSQDNGASWHAANTSLQNSTVLSFAADSLYLYAGTNTGVFRSKDNGVTWSAANDGIQSQLISCMVVGGGYLFAGTVGSGVYKSDDNGNSWSDASGGALNSSNIIAMCYVNTKGVLMVEGDNYLFKSIDAGHSWYVDQGNTAFYVIKHFLVVGDTVLASARNGVFHSYNGGKTFSKFLPVESDDYTDLLGFSLWNGVVYTGDKKGMFYSNNYGLSWTAIANAAGLRIGNRFNNYFIRSGSDFIMGMDEIGVYRSRDTGRTWQQAIKGFPAASSIDNSMLAIGDTILTGTHSDGIYGTINAGDKWKTLGPASNRDTLSNAIVYCLLHPAPNILLAGTGGDGLYRSENNGKTWTHITAGLPYKQADNYESDQAITQCGNNILLATSNGIFYSSNNGLTWKASNIAGDRQYVSAIAANGNVAVAGVVQGVFPFNSGFYRSTNKGVSWNFVQRILDDVVCLDGDGKDHFYGGSFGSNWRSSNNGQSWETMGVGIPPNAGGYTIKVIDTVHIFIGNDQGVFHSSNGGNNFSNISVGLDPAPNRSVLGLTASSDYLFAGFANNGVWRVPLAKLGIRSMEKSPVAAVAPQKQSGISSVRLVVSPNPVHSTATIQITLAEAGNVQLLISGGDGKLVRLLKAGMKKGSNTMQVDAQQWLPGNYFIQLSLDGRSCGNTMFVVTR